MQIYMMNADGSDRPAYNNKAEDLDARWSLTVLRSLFTLTAMAMGSIHNEHDGSGQIKLTTPRMRWKSQLVPEGTKIALLL